MKMARWVLAWCAPLETACPGGTLAHSGQGTTHPIGPPHTPSLLLQVVVEGVGGGGDDEDGDEEEAPEAQEPALSEDPETLMHEGMRAHFPMSFGGWLLPAQCARVCARKPAPTPCGGTEGQRRAPRCVTS